MKAVFADASFWVALLNPKDDLHEKARAVSESLGPVHVVTSEMVLVELLNEFAGRGEALKAAAEEDDSSFGYSVAFDLLPIQEAVNSLYSTIASNQAAWASFSSVSRLQVP